MIFNINILNTGVMESIIVIGMVETSYDLVEHTDKKYCGKQLLVQSSREPVAPRLSDFNSIKNAS